MYRYAYMFHWKSRGKGFGVYFLFCVSYSQLTELVVFEHGLCLVRQRLKNIPPDDPSVGVELVSKHHSDSFLFLLSAGLFIHVLFSDTSDRSTLVIFSHKSPLNPNSVNVGNFTLSISNLNSFSTSIFPFSLMSDFIYFGPPSPSCNDGTSYQCIW